MPFHCRLCNAPIIPPNWEGVKSIYYLIGETGEYSDYRTWIVGCYETRQAALAIQAAIETEIAHTDKSKYGVPLVFDLDSSWDDDADYHIEASFLYPHTKVLGNLGIGKEHL